MTARQILNQVSLFQARNNLGARDMMTLIAEYLSKCKYGADFVDYLQETEQELKADFQKATVGT